MLRIGEVSLNHGLHGLRDGTDGEVSLNHGLNGLWDGTDRGSQSESRIKWIKGWHGYEKESTKINQIHLIRVQTSSIRVQNYTDNA